MKLSSNFEVITFIKDSALKKEAMESLNPKMLVETHVVAIIAHKSKKIFLWQGALTEMREIFQAMDYFNERIKTESEYPGYTIEREVDGGESDDFDNLFN